jgi:hypothetical protein
MKNLRRQLLINPSFQLRFALIFTLAVLVFCIVISAFAISGLEFLSQNANFANDVSRALFVTARENLIWMLAGVHAAIAVVAFNVALFNYQKIAGPRF